MRSVAAAHGPSLMVSLLLRALLHDIESGPGRADRRWKGKWSRLFEGDDLLVEEVHCYLTGEVQISCDRLDEEELWTVHHADDEARIRMWSSRRRRYA